MKFSDDKKSAIIFYLLEKIAENGSASTKVVAEKANVNQSTVHAYLKELINDNIIRKIKRGQYELISAKKTFILNRKNGDLDTDIYAFDICLSESVKNLPANVKEIWNYAFSEMINNVVDHSQAETARIEIVQNYLTTLVWIFDDGIGIFKKIKNHFKLNSVEEAICELFKGKLTTDSVNHSGEGIFFSSKLMDDFYIVSSGKIFTNNKYDNSLIIDLASEKQKGTCVMMALSNFSQKTAKKVFDLYADIDGGFIKTRIPLKNIFESSPVSRSQAKRICSRLEQFKKVVIDFDGLNWMGQGFAHQLFVVFANSHPQIELIPINMNEDVTKMYNHVVLSIGDKK